MTQQNQTHHYHVYHPLHLFTPNHHKFHHCKGKQTKHIAIESNTTQKLNKRESLESIHGIAANIPIGNLQIVDSNENETSKDIMKRGKKKKKK